HGNTDGATRPTRDWPDEFRRVASRGGHRGRIPGKVPMRPPWVIVLAGGEGHRFRPTIERWFGEQRPKQFCALMGSRSLVQHALDRAAAITDPDRIVTVIGPGQRELLEQATRPKAAGAVIEQSMDRGSASAVMFALVHALLRDPDAT